MRKIHIIVPALLAISSFSVSAMELGGEVGQQHLQLKAATTTEDNGLIYNASWTKNFQDGPNVGGAGVDYQLSYDFAKFHAGIKTLYIAPKKGDNGFAVPFGGGVDIPVNDSINIYGESYVAPRGLNNAVENYVEVDAGVAWKPNANMKVNVGYRYMGVNGKSSTPNHTLLDGAYIGSSLSF